MDHLSFGQSTEKIFRFLFRESKLLLELYNLKDDPREETDLSHLNPGKVKELQEFALQELRNIVPVETKVAFSEVINLCLN